ncbi:MAG: flagellar basal body P-ring protein FlgI [Phycisphaerae bacterium]|nr:flagellar basal body P-ring protein FlgI [Phycisphaerae bacterium]
MKGWFSLATSCSGMLAVVLVAGCSDWMGKSKKPTTRPAGTTDSISTASPQQATLALQGAIGAATYVEGGRLLPVRGYGLVVGLGGKGSRNCPPSVRDYLRKELARQRVTSTGDDDNVPSPDALLNSLDTAVVVVDAEVPAAAAKQRAFDVRVQAMDPDTQSIAGGILLPCDLKIYREVGPAEVIEGKTHAQAQGPVFTNPFVGGANAGTTVDPREGLVIGGGSNLVVRKVEMVCVVESYSVVRQIRDVINRRFPTTPPAADAISPTTVQLTIPAEYRGRENRFIEKVRYLPLTSSNAQLEARAKALIVEFTRENAPLEELSLAVEGVGLSAVRMLQPLYTHPRKAVNYYAARAGLRLGDNLGVEVVVRHAEDPKSSYRRMAVRELGHCVHNPRAIAALRTLLTDPEVQLRLLAYESLRDADPEGISQVVVGKKPQNFVLEVVESSGPATVYARRSQFRRIALIGGDRMVCRPPLLYSQQGKPITLSADEGDRSLTLIRKNASGGILIGPIQVPPDVPTLVRFLGQDLSRNFEGKVEGLGLDYAVILDLLYRLSEQGGLSADVRWEESSIEDLFGPVAPVGRPESEL